VAPVRRLTKILIAIGAAIVLLAALAFAGWYFFLKSDPEPRVSIKKTSVAEGGALNGTYRVSPGDANSIVGYRVQEVLAAVGFESTATGRTSDITGSFTIEGVTVKDVNVTANLLSLKSDRDMRDNRIKTLGLESEKFPESKFVLAQPINFQSIPKAGETVKATAVGDFTLHGGDATGVDPPRRALGRARHPGHRESQRQIRGLSDGGAEHRQLRLREGRGRDGVPDLLPQGLGAIEAPRRRG
jgi:polyisoprenoid-binding protein YceI